MDTTSSWTRTSGRKSTLDPEYALEPRHERLASSPPSCRWLLEVNASPSYLASCPEDYEMKFRLLEDTLNVVDIERR